MCGIGIVGGIWLIDYNQVELNVPNLSRLKLDFNHLQYDNAITVWGVLMRTTCCFHSAEQIVFGRDAVLQLGDIASRLNARRALIVTDLNLVEAGLPDRVRGPLEASGLAVATFTGGEAEPSMHVVESCVEMAEQFQLDLFVGLGGGSNMDLAKITATIFAHGGHPRDYVGDDKVPD